MALYLLTVLVSAAWPRLPELAGAGESGPRPHVFAPLSAEALPTDRPWATLTVLDRTYVIRRVAAGADIETTGGLAIQADEHEALTFVGRGRAGLLNDQRLVIEDCTFVLDFEEGDFGRWDARRCAVYASGFAEVIIRRCVFISRGQVGDPVRKTNSSLYLADCRNVLVEDCYFEGLTNWMRGHVTIFCCGPTLIRRCEVSGVEQNGRWICGGGLWVANGVGEGKVGHEHAEQPELMLYPSGPALIEGCWLHDQQGRDNTDGIYLQSIHDFLVRDCRVERWQEDALMDVGFRDSARGNWRDRPLANHGAVGLVERCEFGGGYLKNSVGAGGGVVYLDNTLRDVWMMPYIFDGGGWWFVRNEFTDCRRPLVAGTDLRGWTPPEGMLVGGSRFHFLGNRVVADAPLPALFRSSKVKASPLPGRLVSDHNLFELGQEPPIWADDPAAGRRYSLAEWRAETGNDRQSALTGQRPGLPAELSLPGGMTLPGDRPAGPAGPCGLTETMVARRDTARVRWRARVIGYEVEDLPVLSATAVQADYPNAGASGGKYRLYDAKEAEQELVLGLPVTEAGEYWLSLHWLRGDDMGRYQVLLDEQPVGEAIDLTLPGPQRVGLVTLPAGERRLTFRVLGQGARAKGFKARLDRVVLVER